MLLFDIVEYIGRGEIGRHRRWLGRGEGRGYCRVSRRTGGPILEWLGEGRDHCVVIMVEEGRGNCGVVKGWWGQCVVLGRGRGMNLKRSAQES